MKDHSTTENFRPGGGHKAAGRVFAIMSIFLPRRVYEEEFGDALETIAEMERSGRSLAAIALKIVFSILWAAVNSLVYIYPRPLLPIILVTTSIAAGSFALAVTWGTGLLWTSVASVLVGTGAAVTIVLAQGVSTGHALTHSSDQSRIAPENQQTRSQGDE